MISIENDQQLEALQEFKRLVADTGEDEVTCIRFLIARDFKFNLAEEMLRNNIKWRRETDITSLTAVNPLSPEIREDFSFEFLGKNKLGGPVIYMPMGVWKARYHIDKGKKDEVVKFSYFLLENILKQITMNGNIRATVIMCMNELTYSKIGSVDTLKTFYAGFQTLEQNYPEILQHLFVANAPRVFTIAFNFIKPILSPRTLSKFQVHGSDKSKWLPKLKEICDNTAIPSHYLK